MSVYLEGESSYISDNETVDKLQNSLGKDIGVVNEYVKFIVDCYKNSPETLTSLMIKYEETFRIFCETVKEARDKHIVNEIIFQQKLKEMIVYPSEEFVKLNNILSENKKLQRKTEVKLIEKQIEGEIDMLQQIKNMKEV